MVFTRSQYKDALKLARKTKVVRAISLKSDEKFIDFSVNKMKEKRLIHKSKVQSASAEKVSASASKLKNRLIEKWKSSNGPEELVRELEPIVAEIASPGMSRQKILRKALTSLGYDQGEVSKFLKLESRLGNASKGYSHRQSVYVKKVGRSSYMGTVGGGAPGLGGKK